MSQSTSPAGGRKRRRTFTKRFYNKAAAYYQSHGWKATADKFRISGQTMQRVREWKPNGLERLEKWAEDRAPEETRTGRSLYLAAKALERALMAHRKAGNPSSDIEHYAFFLLREILK